MKPAPLILLPFLILAPAALSAADDIILRLRPEPNAPAITRITATDKVLVEAAPTGEKRDWRQLELKIPFEGYVPAAALTKNFAIAPSTPVHSQPDSDTDIITRTRDGDLYEVRRVGDDWATVQFNKELTTYFQAGDAGPAVSEPEPVAPGLDLSPSAPSHTPEPDAVDYDPNSVVGRTSPEELPPENVVWKSAPRSPAPVRGPLPQAAENQTTPRQRTEDIMVGRAETQAREADKSELPEPDKALRELRGILVREIEPEGPSYPVRLRSPEGRLIAYVDFSGIFIEDLEPYLDQRVVLRGQVAPVQQGDKDLVIFTHEIELTD